MLVEDFLALLHEYDEDLHSKILYMDPRKSIPLLDEALGCAFEEKYPLADRTYEWSKVLIARLSRRSAVTSYSLLRDSLDCLRVFEDRGRALGWTCPETLRELIERLEQRVEAS